MVLSGVYCWLSADAEGVKLPEAGSVTGAGLTINRVTQAAAFTYIQQVLLTTHIYSHVYLCCSRFDRHLFPILCQVVELLGQLT